MAGNANNLVWLDMEMTGLIPDAATALSGNGDGGDRFELELVAGVPDLEPSRATPLASHGRLEQSQPLGLIDQVRSSSTKPAVKPPKH